MGAALFLPVYLCVSHTEALLMASNTSYLGVYREHQLFHALFIHRLLPVNI
jgi:hypothetical protein